MLIDDLKYGRRRVLQENKDNEYSPKKRWDQGSFGSQRNLLHNHVQNVLREHQNDKDILDKFRRQAQELKQRKRREKFPHLYPSQNLMSNCSQLRPKIKSSPIMTSQIQTPNNYMGFQPQDKIVQQPNTQQQPQLIYSIINPMQNYMLELESRLQYERVIAHKDLQLYKRQQKIKKQRSKIDKLYRQLKYRQKEDELQKYINYQNEIQKMNKALKNIKVELTDRKQKFSSRKKSFENQKDSSVSIRQKKNKSEIFLNREDKLPTVSRISEHKSQKQLQMTSLQKNPEILYSPKAKKNKSSVFQNVNLYNPIIKLSQVDGHLQELMNYNSKLQHFHKKNNQKLKKLK